jgi:hypothetical protein
VVEALFRDTGGNPFFVGEIVRLLASVQQLGSGSRPVRSAFPLPSAR